MVRGWAKGVRRSSRGRSNRPRVFCVHYRFLSCGTVFETGLREAAETIGVTANTRTGTIRAPHESQRFRPDLLLVVHGRRFVQRWGGRFNSWRSAVWLLDEPYEVDDTSSWSRQFDHVFVNDAVSLARHRNAHVLPVAYAPALHHAAGRGRAPVSRRLHRRREPVARARARRARPARAARLCRRRSVARTRLRTLCLAENIPAEQTASLYRDTIIVINVFRDRHHFNHVGLVGTAMNPRICEALACGALVLSEPRDGLRRDVSELPVFRSEAEAASLIERFLADAGMREEVQRACAARLRNATYSERLKIVMELAFEAPVPPVGSEPVAHTQTATPRSPSTPIGSISAGSRVPRTGARSSSIPARPVAPAPSGASPAGPASRPWTSRSKLASGPEPA